VKWRARAAVPNKGIVECRLTGTSIAGGYIEFPYMLPPKSEILLEFHPVIKQQFFAIKARFLVVHSTILADDRGVGLGLKLLQMTKEHKEIMSKAIAELEARDY
jgi:hypothetical protein